MDTKEKFYKKHLVLLYGPFVTNNENNKNKKNNKKASNCAVFVALAESRSASAASPSKVKHFEDKSFGIWKFGLVKDFIRAIIIYLNLQF